MTVQNEFIVAELDFTHVLRNQSVQEQGIITCIQTGNKGWFWLEAGKFPSRQDLAIVTNKRTIKLS